MTTTKGSNTIRRRAHRAVLAKGLGSIAAVIIAEMCLTSPGHAQSSSGTCVFVGNNGPVGAPAGRIDAFLSTQGTLSPAGNPTSVPQGGAQKMLVRAHTLLALTPTTLLSFDINSACGLALQSTVAVPSVPDMALGDAVVYVSSSTQNDVSSVALDWGGNFSAPVMAPVAPNATPSVPLSVAAVAPMVYSHGRNLCKFPVQTGGMLGTPTCGPSSSKPVPLVPLLVAGDVLYELFRTPEVLRAYRIDQATGNLTFVDTFPITATLDDLPVGPDPRAMAAWPDGSVVFVAAHGGIVSVGAPTSTQPHTVLASSPVVGNAVALATDPQFPFLYAADAAQGALFSIPVSGGSVLPSSVAPIAVADQPISVATWKVCAALSPAQACGGRACGSAYDGCGAWVTCGSSCCTAAEVCGTKVCGTASDGCGRQRSCGFCASGTTCNLGTCIRSCPQGQVFCDGHCTRPTNCQ